MEFQNGLLNKEKDKLNNEGQNLDFDSQIKNLIIFSLYYSNPNIMINTFCFNKNHKNTIPLKEFLIKYHPFYNKYKKFNFCDKCMLKLLYSKKLNFTFYTNYCIKCDKHFCAHSINHVHELKMIEKEYFIDENFVFPICPTCNPIFNCDKMNEYQLKNKYINSISESLLEIKNKFIEIENDFNNSKGKIYLSLYPYFKYYMSNNFLEILLCENLLKTYSTLRKKNEMYFRAIKNIENLFTFDKLQFNLGIIEDIHIETLINHFSNINNCFLFSSKEKYFEFENFFIFPIKEYNYIMDKKAMLIYSFSLNEFIFQEIKKSIYLTNEGDIYIHDFYNIGKSIFVGNLEENPQNILYIKNNLFFFQYCDKLILYNLNDDGKNIKLEQKNIIMINKEKKIYSKILSTKNKMFICFTQFIIDFYSYDSSTKNAIFIKTLNDIKFIKRINENLIIYPYASFNNNFFVFLNENGEEIKQIFIKDNICLNEEQICIYKKKYLLVIFSNSKNIFLINIINFEIIKNIDFYNKLIEIKELNDDNIISNKNDKSLFYYKKKKFSLKKNHYIDYNKNYPVIAENEIGIIIFYNKHFFLLKDIENEKTSMFEINLVLDVNGKIIDYNNLKYYMINIIPGNKQYFLLFDSKIEIKLFSFSFNNVNQN